ncbi:MAG: ribosome biogenesis GTP-binding protein YihA/YsxC [Ignavibacteriaceae bacterium]|jgi:GTP-binding protein|nr:MAG: YihA family ribosome biogenesis GTP-binding protein [Chlorobiota bacterium]KXK06152.1 MAG: GTPase [Chlorobi bacterium OLB4]MBV6398580.1 putative GTP-binding protein EngB [Ignavibacteria bacterium]MCC6885814.1 YihA family ribosome biogenesis GTP-binding protein [Ignavibacteriales bacterium]MCE7952991.1 YihA family ribosome biogenesis GTP-binding protein [Chlorobi bacterium CHB7]MDL1887171.1 YihA family ribosome biogenesis GTP-binding protein [Ignavibacteria bacterium CHB1]MEB2329226.1 
MLKIKSAEFINSIYDLRTLPKSVLSEFVLVGRSNVGKSSLINCICNRKSLAKIGSVPGKTRQLNYFLINQDFYLVDLPGYGYAKVPEQIRAGWRKLVEDYISERENVNMVFVLIDSRHDPNYLDELMVSWLEYYEIPYALILTKSDKISANKMEKQIYRVSKIVNNEELCLDYIPFSIITGEGKQEILKLIETKLEENKKNN